LNSDEDKNCVSHHKIGITQKVFLNPYDENIPGLHHVPRQKNNKEVKRLEEHFDLYLGVGQRKNRVLIPIFQAFDDKYCEEKQHTISEAINTLNENQITAAIVEQTLWNALLIFMFQACPISSIGCITYYSGETSQASKTTSNFSLNVYFLALEEKRLQVIYGSKVSRDLS
jgi:hypothetical protein